MKYKINEIFYSLQGEGARAGTANVFVRFAGCDLTCNFCDTEFESYTEMTGEEISKKILELMPNDRSSVILTGGEPALQYDQNLHDWIRGSGVSYIAIETNGGTKLKADADWITCSPKVAEHVIAKNFPDGVTELKYVRNEGQGIPRPKINSLYRYVSPQANADRISMESLNHCIQLVKDNPEWRLSVQQHKLWGVR